MQHSSWKKCYRHLCRKYPEKYPEKKNKAMIHNDVKNPVALVMDNEKFQRICVLIQEKHDDTILD
jgi:hypothetical protein